MMRKKCLIFSVLVLFILCIGFASASDSDLELSQVSDAESDIVQSEDDVPLESTVAPEGKSFNDIQKAVDSAKDNDVIELNGTYTSLGKDIAVKKSLTFHGVGDATLDAKKLSGIFHITKKVTVTFNNIRFINAKYGVIFADSDGFVDDVNVNLNINGCSFENNRNDYEGGAINAFTAGLCKVTDSNFTGNYVEEPDCDIYPNSYGGAISAYNLELKNCNFIKNHAQRDGGAITFLYTARITDCLFKGNYANLGGAINGNKLYLTNTTFESNYLKSFPGLSDYCGGAVNSEYVNAVRCTFKGNSATYSGGKGGAIYGYEIDVKDSKFENNVANYAGAIYCDNAVGEDDYEPGVLKISNCSFISNKEGAVRSPKIIVNNSKTFNNKTLDNGLKAMSPFKVTADKLVTVYYSGKTLKIKVLINPSGKPAKKLQLLVVVKSSKKTYSIPIVTDSNGVATLKASKLDAGYYKISVYEAFGIWGADPGDERYVKVPGVLKTTTLNVKKAKAIVKAPKVKFKHKKSKYFKVTLKHKTTKKAMGGIKLKLKVYTGKKFKTYTVKTNKNGVAKFNTKKLKYGKHKVKIMSGNKNVIVSKKSMIRIR
jgi:hypothetical protein